MASSYLPYDRKQTPIKYLASALLLVVRISSNTFYASSVYPSLKSLLPSKTSFDLSCINLFNFPNKCGLL